MRAILLACTAMLLLAIGGARAAAGTLTLNAGQESQAASFNLGAGDAIQYSYSAGLSVVMLIAQGGTEVFNSSSMAAHGTFTASAAGMYTVSFRNDAAYMNAVSYSLDQVTSPANASGNRLVYGVIGTGIAAVAGTGAALALRARGRKAPPTPPQ